MASPIEIERNLPDTLPADFGDWDDGNSQTAPPAGAPAWKPLETPPKETPQRESARREAEALDFAKKPSVPREVSREFEPARNVTPFPESDEIPATPRGIPAPVIRAPRTSPLPAPSSNSSSPVQDDSAFVQRMKSVDKVVDKLPAVEVRKEEVPAAPVSLIERRPDKRLFSSIAIEEPEASEDELRPTLLNDLLDEEEERKTRRKWITTGCIFGGALLLVVFQLIHYTTASKIKHIVNTPPVAVTSPEPATSAEPESVPETIADVKPAAEKPSAAKQSSEFDAEQVDDTPAQPAEKAPGAAQTRMMQTQLMAPTRLPENAKTAEPNDAPPPSSLGGASIAALNGNNSVGNVFAGRSNSKVSVSGPRPVTVSAGVAIGMLVHQTQPVYPSIARSARVQGIVVLDATISKTGRVVNVKVMSGPPMLRQSAIDAVKTWQYKPYTLNGEPTDVDTTINVNFSFGG
jgi:protein TonB